METWLPNPEQTQAFITRWQEGGGSERANYQLFLMELCELLELPKADPASDDTRDNAYVFERRVIIKKPDGSVTNGYIDLYKRGCFVLEAKQSGLNMETGGWDRAMLRAHNQADQYVRALPSDEGRPPFIIVTDVGRSIELYAEFSRSGATYTPFPDAQAAAEEELLKRLVELNAERAAEEAQGNIRWLRPEYQDPNYGTQQQPTDGAQTELDTTTEPAEPKVASGKTAWPQTMREQISAVRNALQTGPQTAEQLASQFRRNPQTAVQSVLDALQELGIVTQKDDSLYSLAGGN